MSIRTGNAAEPFALPARPGEVVDVAESIGKKPIILLFFPLAFSPVCSDEMCRMRDDWSKWTELNAAVYGISVDSPFVTAKFRDDLNIPFPILSDFNKTVSHSYGALHEDLMGLKGVSKRAAFVIDASGKVVYDWVSDDPKAMPDFSDIEQAVRGAVPAA